MYLRFKHLPWLLAASGMILPSNAMSEPMLRAAESRPLSFGMLAAPGSNSFGSVMISSDGRQSCINLRCLGGAVPGLFHVSGAEEYVVQFLVSPTTLQNKDGAQIDFAPNLDSGTQIIPKNGRGIDLKVGGRLSVNSEIDPGKYYGSFTLFLEYQ
jgi:hypothetical protein